jgi:acyl-coenzyme A synthetase/AMP-(fatty) acid ligase
MPKSTLNLLHKEFPDVDLRQTYGMIELGVLRSKSLSKDSLWVKIGGEGYRLRVVDGILQVRAESAMIGYINEPNPFTEDGYFITGDVVEQEGEWLKILGRNSDIINVGGQKVYPSEVEAAILNSPLVEDVMVYGENYLLTGKIVCADIVLSPEVSKSEARLAILEECNQTLQKYMIPMKIRFVDGSLQTARLKRMRTPK